MRAAPRDDPDMPDDDRTRTAQAASAPLPVDRFAWRVAAPLDFVINLAINGGIAAWLFRGSPRVPLTSGLSVASMVVPMSFLLCAITTLFGWWNAVRERRSGRVTPPLPPGVPWLGRAMVDALAAGSAAVAVTWLATVLAGATVPQATVSPGMATAGVGLLAGLLGYGFHGRAVTRGGRIGTPPAGRG